MDQDSPQAIYLARIVGSDDFLMLHTSASGSGPRSFSRLSANYLSGYLQGIKGRNFQVNRGIPDEQRQGMPEVRIRELQAYELDRLARKG